MATEADKSFAEAVIRLKLADESAVRDCMKTVVDGSSPGLAEAMIEEGVLDRDAADRARRESQPQPQPQPGDPDEEPSPTIDGYEIIRKLGEGGMGCVWLARQTSLDRLVAIKVLPSVFSGNEKLVERFRREALATAKLNHPNIVSAIDVGVQKREGETDLYYFVIEYVDGESLGEIIDRAGKIEPMRAVRIASDVAVGLDHAWTEAEIVHRDIKPANILVTRAGEVKVADLGLARSSYESASLTTAGLAIGTPHYASPEQALGKAAIDVRSDIYGLGATLFHMLTGQPPFEGESAAAVMARHVNEDAPLCSDLNPLIRPALAAIVAKMMKRDPAERYQSPGELRADLERFLSGDRPLAYTRLLDALESRQGVFATGLPEVFDKKKAAEKRARRENARSQHWPHAVMAALLVAVLGAVLWYVTRGLSPFAGSPPPASATTGDGVALWFDVSNPDRVVGSGGSFPLTFSSKSGVRCYVKPNAPSSVYVVLVSSGGPSGPASLRLLAPSKDSPTPSLTNTLTRFPESGGFYSLPPSARLVAFIAIASDKAVPRAEAAAALARISSELSSGALGLRAGIPQGRTLWVGDSAGEWLTGSGAAASGEAADALAAVCKKLRAAFGGGTVSMNGAATACSADE